jgi:hypothetical protein
LVVRAPRKSRCLGESIFPFRRLIPPPSREREPFGWVFLAQGLLNLIAGLYDFGSLVSVFRILLPLLRAIVLFAYVSFSY